MRESAFGGFVFGGPVASHIPKWKKTGQGHHHVGRSCVFCVADCSSTVGWLTYDLASYKVTDTKSLDMGRKGDVLH